MRDYILGKEAEIIFRKCWEKPPIMGQFNVQPIYDAINEAYKQGGLDAHKHTQSNFEYYENRGWNEAIYMASKIARNWHSTEEVAREMALVISNDIEKLKK